MEDTSVSASAPGKLYIAGEYAVVDGSSAIVAAVNRYVTVRMTPVNTQQSCSTKTHMYTHNGHNAPCVATGTITSEGAQYDPLVWGRYADTPRPTLTPLETQDSQPYQYVLAAIHTVETLAYERACVLNAFDMHITSDLDDEQSGRKLGLGSSAAVTVAVVRAMCQWYDLPLDTPQLCKLAMVASASVKGSGSGGDVACSMYGGWIGYHAYDRAWLQAEISRVESGDSTLQALLQRPWPRLNVHRLRVHPCVQLFVGWTGSPASSARLVANVHEHREAQCALSYEDFCANSQIVVESLMHALHNGDLQKLKDGCARNRALLQALQRLSNTAIETPLLQTLIEDAVHMGFASKTSGAGGGDCGIALAVDAHNEQITALRTRWQKHGITLLDVTVAPINGSGVNDDIISAPVSQSTVVSQSLQISQRKNDHVDQAFQQYDERGHAGFADVCFVPNAVPNGNVDSVDMSVDMCGTRWTSPIYINAMTGGSSRTAHINASFARVAAATGVAMASGSLSAALKDARLEDSFRVIRRENPRGFVFANVSASASVEDARRAVEILQANALQIHVNAAQELVMQEGDRDFGDWLPHIGRIVEALEDDGVPVVVKETGCGMSADVVQRLAQAGVKAVDVSGRGGTNFVGIENARRSDGVDYAFLRDWGLTTVESLLEVADARCNGRLPASLTLCASGGVRTPLDVARALGLGANAVGVAGEFLHTLLQDGEDALMTQIRGWHTQLRAIMTLLGCANVEALRVNTSLLVGGRSQQFAELRGIDLHHLARRGA